MTITEYNNYFKRYFQKIVKRYVTEKYKDVENIICYFDPYVVSTDINDAHCYDSVIVELSKKDYTKLLNLIVAHNDITFEQLPLYIPMKLYRHIIGSFHFIHIYTPEESPFRRKTFKYPIAVSMTTMHKDAKELVRGEVCSILVESCTPYKEFQSACVHVDIWNGIIEVYVHFYDKEKNLEYTNIYGMIDSQAFLSALHVQSFYEVGEAFGRIKEEYTSKNKSDITWLVQWLDVNGINYLHAEGVSQNEYMWG